MFCYMPQVIFENSGLMTTCEQCLSAMRDIISRAESVDAEAATSLRERFEKHANWWQVLKKEVQVQVDQMNDSIKKVENYRDRCGILRRQYLGSEESYLVMFCHV